MSILISEYFAELTKVENEIKEELLEEILDYEYEAANWEAYERTLNWLEAENKKRRKRKTGESRWRN